jgi:hypothetical protein
MYINKRTLEVVNHITIRGLEIPVELSQESVEDLGYALITDTPRPTNKRGRVINIGEITLQDGVYTQTWDIDDSGVDAMGDLRYYRNKHLADSDWTQAVDSTKVVTSEKDWATYRQDLRDLPATFASNPEEVIWPTTPDYVDVQGD